jgi:hypothetical protein
MDREENSLESQSLEVFSIKINENCPKFNRCRAAIAATAAPPWTSLISI